MAVKYGICHLSERKVAFLVIFIKVIKSHASVHFYYIIGGYQIHVINRTTTVTMARRRNSDNLHQAARLQLLRLTRYVRARPEYRFHSMRLQRLRLILDEAAHIKFIEEAYDILAAGSKAADLVGGLHVLLVVRDVLLDHGIDMRSNIAAPSAVDHRFTILKSRDQVHPMCPIKRKLPRQIEYLQKLGAEMEGIAITLFLESKLIKNETITKAQSFGSDHVFHAINPEAEKALNDLWMIHLS